MFFNIVKSKLAFKFLKNIITSKISMATNSKLFFNTDRKIAFYQHSQIEWIESG